MQEPSHADAAALATTASPSPPSLSPEGAWQRLPPQARLLCLLDALPLALPVAAPAIPLAAVLDLPMIATVAVCLALGLAIAIAYGLRSYRHTYWTLDPHGLAIRRGRSWQRETRVPLNRVQHLDLKQGPIQRRRDLATLVVYTAGTRHSSVNLPHLDHADATRLRDLLGSQLDHDHA